MIHIADTKVERGYGNFFIRQIIKFEEVRCCYLAYFLHFVFNFNNYFTLIFVLLAWSNIDC
jgi:hypothetical protein